MKKMYTNKPIVVTESESNLTIITEKDDKKRIKTLEDEVRQLKEQLHKMASALNLNSRQFRRTTTDINNLTTAIHNVKRG
jgi:predicted  nucleic acid-binding Zn-ribbon protein